MVMRVSITTGHVHGLSGQNETEGRFHYSRDWLEVGHRFQRV